MSAYRITEVGFENTEAIFFRTTIEMASEYDISEWSWVGSQVADVILVNSDQEECTSQFNIDKPARTNLRPILIGCSSSGKKCDSFSYSLKKPITYSKIISLLLKLELELAAIVQTSPPLKEQHDRLNKAQHSSSPLQKQMLSETESQAETHAFSIAPPFGDNQGQNDQHIRIDDDSDYDIYELLMESEFDNFQPKVTPVPYNGSQQAANDQSNRSRISRRITIKNLMNHSAWRLLGLIKKRVLSTIKHSG
jgi:hypothetical protein